jgi:hypothetical protein
MRINVQKWRCVHFNHRSSIKNGGEFRRFVPLFIVQVTANGKCAQLYNQFLLSKI